MSERGGLRLATRGSDLARRQAGIVRDALAGRRLSVEIREIETEGDRVRDELIHRLGRTGAFVRALDEAVLAGEADAAVHSMKDMPTEMPEGLVVAGVPERAPAGDLLVTPDGRELPELPEGAVVGTSSLRRRAQLLARRPDLEVRPLRGNVDTRVEKLLAPHRQREHERRLDAAGEGVETGDGEGDADEGTGEEFDRTPGEWFDSLSPVERRAMERAVDDEDIFDAIVLAAAGLERSGLRRHVPTAGLSRERFVPAPGQGALAVTASDPDVVERVRSAVDDPRTRVTTTVERTVLAELGGGCIAPIGVHATLQGEYVATRVQVFGPDGDREVSDVRDLPVTDHAEAAAAFAADLAEEGAADLVAAAEEAE